jgi:hypothetical protein
MRLRWYSSQWYLTQVQTFFIQHDGQTRRPVDGMRDLDPVFATVHGELVEAKLSECICGERCHESLEVLRPRLQTRPRVYYRNGGLASHGLIGSPDGLDRARGTDLYATGSAPARIELVRIENPGLRKLLLLVPHNSPVGTGVHEVAPAFGFDRVDDHDPVTALAHSICTRHEFGAIDSVSGDCERSGVKVFMQPPISTRPPFTFRVRYTALDSKLLTTPGATSADTIARSGFRTLSRPPRSRS